MHIPFATTGSYPVRTGNLVRPLIDGEPAFRRICKAIEGAKRSVWATIAFHDEDFRMPDGRGSLFDVLDRARARGLDVRVNFWRINDEANFVASSTFYGNDAQRKMLSDRGAKFLARWDRAYKAYCQHQKSWIIDAGQPDEVAFVGGINLNNASVVSPGHQEPRDKHTHDIYLELAGPCASDVHHNFVQRWNEASERGVAGGVWPDVQACNDLGFPSRLSATAGPTTAQVQRTVRAGHYSNDAAAPGHEPFDIAKGEATVFQQYQAAISAAKHSIYFENQALGCPTTVDALHAALKRGVDVVVLTPADANSFMTSARKDPRSKAFFDGFDALAQHDNFLLAGIAAAGEGGEMQNVYVHAKAGVVDDAWVTIGSCNIGARSFFGDTELNVSFWSPDIARQFRVDLLNEHLAVDTTGLDDRGAYALYRRQARENAVRRRDGVPMQGLAFAMDPRTYAVQS
ncbi:MAG: phosphatidylserine/phosphatidylglycerophosphate/cardiolipin synthase family protein [Micropepsaceae bacterium]